MSALVCKNGVYFLFYFHFVLKLNRTNASKLYCLTQLFTTPDVCPSFVPLPILVVRCLEVTVKNANAGVKFTFEAKGSKCMCKLAAAIIIEP